MRTIEAETINEAALITRDDAAPVARAGNYEPVRFNAMKHGILSRLAVLAHETGHHQNRRNSSNGKGFGKNRRKRYRKLAK